MPDISGQELRRPASVELYAVVLALLVSLALIWGITGEPLVAAAYGGVLLVLGVAGFALSRRRVVPRADVAGEADWSVTVAAIEQPDCAIAITDRANRLVCANSA